jgi:hypothetical protein
MTSWPYLLHGSTLALAWFLVVNILMSALVVAVVGRAGRSARSLIALRLLPAVASTTFVLAVFVPSYCRFEPRDGVEGFDITITAAAGVAMAVMAAACIRGASAWRQADGRSRLWMAASKPVATAKDGLPAFLIDAPQPLMALVGILRPRLLVTRGLMEALTPEELSASISHEIGHHRARDNFKRLAMRAAPDVLNWTRAARVLERRWAAAAEQTADAVASTEGRDTRFALASALVKIARLMPSSAMPLGEPISTLVGGGAIAARVEWLVDDARDSPRPGINIRWVARLATLLTLGALVTGYAPMLQSVHRVTEILVRSLP